MRSSELRLSQMKTCKELAEKYWPTEFAVTKLVDKIYYEIIKKTPEVKPQTKVQQAIYALSIRSYRALHRALDDIEAGYYEIAMLVLRSVYENYVQMNYFSKHPKMAEEWLVNDKTFNQGFMRKHMFLKSDFYSMISDHYAHPHSVRSIDALVFDVSKEGKISLNHYPVFSDRSYTCLFIWIWLADIVIDQLQGAFKREQIKDEQWIRHIVEIQNVIREYIKSEKASFKKEYEPER